MRRRGFLKILGAGALAGCATPGAAPAGRPVATAKPAPKRILILGGTGFIGPHIVRAARSQGHTVTLFNRGKSNPHLFPDVETILGERQTGRQTDLARLGSRSWDAVIDTWTRYPSAVRAATELLRDRIAHYLFVSTISVYQIGRAPLDESSPVQTTNEPTVETMELPRYGPLKALSEQAAEQMMPGRVTVVRPGVIAGPGDPTDRFTYWPVRLAAGGDVLVPEGSDYRLQCIDVRDLGQWIITAIEARHFGTYNAVGPADPALPAVLAACQAGVGSSARLQWVPDKWLEKNDVRGWEAFPLVVGGDSPMSGFAHVSAARAVAAGLRFRSLAETARDTLGWWSAQSEERRNQKRPGLSREREAELLKLWRAQAAAPG
jgi:2'-hydroxyisoflavone reductase